MLDFRIGIARGYVLAITKCSIMPDFRIGIARGHFLSMMRSQLCRILGLWIGSESFSFYRWVLSSFHHGTPSFLNALRATKILYTNIKTLSFAFLSYKPNHIKPPPPQEKKQPYILYQAISKPILADRKPVKRAYLSL